MLCIRVRDTHPDSRLAGRAFEVILVTNENGAWKPLPVDSTPNQIFEANYGVYSHEIGYVPLVTTPGAIDQRTLFLDYGPVFPVSTAGDYKWPAALYPEGERNE